MLAQNRNLLLRPKLERDLAAAFGHRPSESRQNGYRRGSTCSSTLPNVKGSALLAMSAPPDTAEVQASPKKPCPTTPPLCSNARMTDSSSQTQSTQCLADEDLLAFTPAPLDRQQYILLATGCALHKYNYLSICCKYRPAQTFATTPVLPARSVSFLVAPMVNYLSSLRASFGNLLALWSI